MRSPGGGGSGHSARVRTGFTRCPPATNIDSIPGAGHPPHPLQQRACRAGDMSALENDIEYRVFQTGPGERLRAYYDRMVDPRPLRAAGKAEWLQRRAEVRRK